MDLECCVKICEGCVGAVGPWWVGFVWVLCEVGGVTAGGVWGFVFTWSMRNAPCPTNSYSLKNFCWLSALSRSFIPPLFPYIFDEKLNYFFSYQLSSTLDSTLTLPVALLTAIIGTESKSPFAQLHVLFAILLGLPFHFRSAFSSWRRIQNSCMWTACVQKREYCLRYIPASQPSQMNVQYRIALNNVGTII